jgi:hypothetical protein
MTDDTINLRSHTEESADEDFLRPRLEFRAVRFVAFATQLRTFAQIEKFDPIRRLRSRSRRSRLVG